MQELDHKVNGEEWPHTFSVFIAPPPLCAAGVSTQRLRCQPLIAPLTTVAVYIFPPLPGHQQDILFCFMLLSSPVETAVGDGKRGLAHVRTEQGLNVQAWGEKRHEPV